MTIEGPEKLHTNKQLLESHGKDRGLTHTKEVDKNGKVLVVELHL